jgi:hypothetical protein
MQAGLQALVPQIAVIQAAPDADIPFLTKLQQIVLLHLHEPRPGAGGPPGAGGAPPPGPGGTAPAGMGLPGGPAGGGAPNPAMPGVGAPEAPTQPGGVSKPMNLPPDEVRRVLAENAGE